MPDRNSSKGSIDWVGDAFTSLVVQELISSSSSELSRYCFHQSEQSDLHIMLINMPPCSSYPIHRHHLADEWYMVIHGRLYVSTYDSLGNKTNSFTLDPVGKICLDSSLTAGLLMHKDTFHDTVTKSERTLFLEIRRGPFDRADTEFLSVYRKTE